MREPIVPLETPVALAIFRRPAETARVLAAIARARPRRLFVIADGPRAAVADDAERCAATRRVVAGVDWDCEVLTDYADVNLGCGRRMASGLDWVFSRTETAIILEDDCVPDPTFFPYCEELLQRYRDDDRVSYISGNNFQDGRRHTRDSYHFSLYGSTWGWASWSRAWKGVDVAMANWPAVRASGALRDVLGDRLQALDYTECLDDTYAGRIDTWDYQFALACWMHRRVSIVPGANLVSNIGFTADATHTTGVSRFANVAAEPMPFPLRHPAQVAADRREDRRAHEAIFGPRLARARHHLRRRLSSVLSPATAAAPVRPPLKWESADEFDVAWKARIASMAAHIDGAGRVADFGCGMMWLEQYLDANHTYLPIDFVRRDARTVVIDFNAGPVPHIDADVAFLSGILEYIAAPLAFMDRILDMGFRQVILSYCPMERVPDVAERRFLGWRNNLSVADLLALSTPRYDVTRVDDDSGIILVFRAKTP